MGLYRIAKSLSDTNYRRSNQLTVFDVLLDRNTLETVFPNGTPGHVRQADDWTAIGKTILMLRSLPQSDIVGNLRAILSDLEIESFVQKHAGIVGISRIYKILQEIRTLVETGRVSTLKDVLDLWKRMDDYRIAFEVPDLDSKKKGVQIMTAHQSKGLEYECVFLPGALNGVWGNTRNMDRLNLPESVTGAALEASEKNEEERRLFFVGLTRAKSILEVSFPASVR
jgi:superfamily I DNA/RNA helicase